MQERRSRVFALALAIPLLLSLLAACGTGTTTPPSQATKTIKIGSDFPVSGNDPSEGLPAQNGVQYAVDEANSQNFLPGYKFVLDHKDDVGQSGSFDSSMALKNYNDLIGDAEVAGVVGPLNSSVAQTVMPIANKAPIAMISPANTNNCLTQDTPSWECAGDKSVVQKLRPTGKVTYFRTVTRDQYQGAALAEYAYKTLKYDSAFVINDNSTYGLGLAKNFIYVFRDLLGGTITNGTKNDQNDAGKSIDGNKSDFSATLTDAASQHPALIFFAGSASKGGTTIRLQMSKIVGLEKTPFMVGDGSKTSAFAKAIIPLGGGPVYGSVPGVDTSQVSKAKAFLDGYQKKYGNSGAYSGGGYDDAWILMKAIKKVIQDNKLNPPANSNDSTQAKTFRQAVIDVIKQADHDGVTGHQSFDANGDTENKSISIYTLGDVKVSDGWKYLTAISLASTTSATATPAGTVPNKATY